MCVLLRLNKSFQLPTKKFANANKEFKTSNDIIAEDGRWKVIWGLIFDLFFPDPTWWCFLICLLVIWLCDKLKAKTLILLCFVPKCSYKKCFDQVRAAPESWSKYTTYFTHKIYTKNKQYFASAWTEWCRIPHHLNFKSKWLLMWNPCSVFTLVLYLL